MKVSFVKHNELIAAVEGIFIKMGVRADVARSFSEGICQNSLRGIDSHGVRLLPHYIEEIDSGRINCNPQYKFHQNSPATCLLDADHAPGHAAGVEGMEKAILLAQHQGVGVVSVFNSTHFGAAGFFGLIAAEKEMIGLSFTNATAHVIPYKGKRAFLGNNPICLCAPVSGEEPFCLDMATTTGTFNGVQRLKEIGQSLPNGWCADENGIETTDVRQAVYLLPIGGYKGFGLSMMVEVLCAVLTDMPFGPNVTRMFDKCIKGKRYLGHFFVAIDISSFVNVEVFKKRIKEMMTELRREQSHDPLFPIMCPGDPEKKAKEERLKNGIPVTLNVLNYIQDQLNSYNLPKINIIN